MPINDVDPESLLSRFAYKPTQHPVQSPPPVRATPGSSRLPATFSTDPQLTQLTKCVCCGLHWTRSKSIKQKRTHIDHCAKKSALTKETVIILIQKETSPAQSTDPSRAPPKDDTFMDSLVSAGPLKKFKRPHVVSTVRSLPETRESILDKAREILGPTSTKALADTQPSQQFAQSALACRNAKRPALLGVNDYTEEPPPTQPFGASLSLLRRGQMITTEHTTGSCEQLISSMFSQDSILSSDRSKRPTSPPYLDDDFRTVRRRRLQ